MRSPVRAGSALVTATVFLILLSSIAVVLTERTVSAMTMEQRRTEELTLALAAESAANKAYVYLQGQSTALLRTDATYAIKAATLPTEAQLEARHAATLISGSALGMTEVNRVPVTARWCYLGQRAVRAGTNAATGDWEIVPLLSFVQGSTLTPAQVASGYVIQDVYKVRAHAVVGTSADTNRWRQRQVDMIFTPTASNVMTRALFARLGYNVQGSPNGDQWNSQGGMVPYSATSVAAGTRTNSIEAGSNGSVSSSIGSIIAKSNLNLAMPVPAVDTSSPYDTFPGSSAVGVLDNSCTLTTGTYHAKYINITSGDLLTINGNVTIYVDGPVKLQTGNGANNAPVLNYNPPLTAKLTIIQADYTASDAQWSGTKTLFDLNGNQTAGSEGNPQQFVFVSAFTGVGTYNGTAGFGGVIYAPNMTLNLNGNFDYYGAILVNSFDGMINGDFKMHYDSSIANMNLPVNVGFSVVGWYSSAPMWGGGTIQ